MTVGFSTIERPLSIISIIIIILSGGLGNSANWAHHISTVGLFEPALATNTIHNQTIQTNLDCDLSSTCNTSMFQSASIPNGDMNEIVQNAIQENQHCRKSSACDGLGTDETNIGTRQPVSVIDLGSNNENHDQISSDHGSFNGNNVNHQLNQKNQNCEDITICQEGESKLTDVGSLLHGEIILSDNSNNNNSTISSSDADSGNKNNLAIYVQQTNNACKEMNEAGCHNFEVGTSTFLDSASGFVFNDFSSNTTNIQSTNNADTGNENTVFQDLHQSNEFCHNAFGCQNVAFQGSIMGGSSNSGIFNLMSNSNKIVDTISSIGSDNGNTVTQKSNQVNRNCSNAAFCSNDVSQSSAWFLHNRDLVNLNGNNNFMKAGITSNNSSNNNKADQLTTQENNNCDGSLCFNSFISSFTELSVAGGIRNTGSNNNISTSIINKNSNNDNQIRHEAKQINNNCTVGSFCANLGIDSVLVGTSLPFIDTNGTNTIISETASNIDKNNNNAVSQNMDQSNHCEDGSNCNNLGNLTVNIDGQSNQKIDQFLTQNNLCIKQSACNNDGKVIEVSGSSSQSNLCLNNSQCSNTGTNNKNICLDGSTCINSGTDTKLISNDSSCSSGVDGSTTICSNGRIISVGKEPEKIT